MPNAIVAQAPPNNNVSIPHMNQWWVLCWKKDMDEELINVDHDKQGRQYYAYAPEFTLETSQEKEYYSSDTTSSTKQLLWWGLRK